jgi:hypothetical protein
MAPILTLRTRPGQEQVQAQALVVLLRLHRPVLLEERPSSVNLSRLHRLEDELCEREEAATEDPLEEDPLEEDPLEDPAEVVAGEGEDR